ncbi:MAG: hypothetical protein H7329_13500 [Opitutaceae bacterium]|nr:hypothetical protein [Cytophagales bacterium]
MRRLSILYKLFFSIFLVSALSLLIFGVLVFFNQKDALMQRTCAQLKSVNILKKNSVEKRLNDDEKFIGNFINKILTKGSRNETLTEKEFKRHKDFLRDFCQLYGHIDIQLTDQKGLILDSLYDVTKENLYTFSREFKVDDKKYNLKLISSTEYLEKLLFENTGMGNTGESYLVGLDRRMITKSRFSSKTPPYSILANTVSVINAFQNRTGTDLISDYRNQKVLSAFAPIFHENIKWAIISEIDESEAMEPVYKLRDILIGVSLLIIIAAFLVAIYLGRIIVGPIREVSGKMLDLSIGIIPSKILPPFFQNEESKMKMAQNKLIESFEKISSFASEIGSGNLEASFTPLGEKDELSTSLLNMRDQLKDYRNKEKLLRRQKALSLLEGQENERRRIAMDLHDGLGQWLTGIKLKIAVIDIPEGQRQELKEMVSETINETRRITNNLMPNSLVDFGLDSAVSNIVSNVEKDSDLTINYSYNSSNSASSIAFEISLTLFRIIQESLNNILKHAKATKVILKIDQGSDIINLLIQDDGIGLPASPKSGSGLGNMEERAKLIGGTFRITNANPGTVISVTIPLKLSENAE